MTVTEISPVSVLRNPTDNVDFIGFIWVTNPQVCTATPLHSFLSCSYINMPNHSYTCCLLNCSIGLQRFQVFFLPHFHAQASCPHDWLNFIYCISSLRRNSHNFGRSKTYELILCVKVSCVSSFIGSEAC